MSIFIVVTCFGKHLVGNKILASAVALNDGRHHVLGHICIVGQKLLGVLGQAVAAVAEARVIVVRTDTWVKSYAADDSLRVQSLHLCVCVQFVEIADTEGKVSVGEELHCLCLFHAHEQCLNVLFNSTFLQQMCKDLSKFFRIWITDSLDGSIFLIKLFPFYLLRVAHNDTAGIKIIIESLAFTQELWRE